MKVFGNLLYMPFKLFPTMQKITFLSRQSNEPSLEYRKIIESLKATSNVKIIVLTKKLEKNPYSFLINCLFLFPQMYHLATSKIAITDGYSVPIGFLKHKKSLIIIQLWHANGIIKKIGLQTLSTRSKFQRNLALKVNMHKHYTYAIASSLKTAEVFEEAFAVSKEQIHILGSPMLDYLLENNNQKKILQEKYNLSSKKKIVVYLPTYRSKPIPFDQIEKHFDFEHYQLVMKKHPVDKSHPKNHQIIFLDKELAEDLLFLADYVITDYSNIAFEAVLLEKKTYFYTYDYEEYQKAPGLNIALKKELPEYTFSHFKDLMEQLEKKKYSYKKIKAFTKQHVSTFDGNCTTRIVKWILELMEEQ